MQMRALFADSIANRNLCPGADSVDEWLDKTWVEIPVGQLLIPVFPVWVIKSALIAHDAHHVLTGYATTLKGELELAAWELASGGCRWSPIFWLDRLTLFALGLIFHPLATARALRSGWGCRNLYGMSVRQILAADVQALRERMRLAPID